MFFFSPESKMIWFEMRALTSCCVLFFCFIDASRTDNRKVVGKEDSDSGLENSSDAGSVWDEELSRTSSESEDLGAEPPVRPERKNKSARPVCLDEEEVNQRELPEFFRELVKGQMETVDFGATVRSRPEWLDICKFKRGQQFAANNLFSLNLAEMLSLIMLFAPSSVLKPLIFTGKSDSPYKAFRRYLSTLTRLKSWYEGDLWGDEENAAKKNMDIVNKMHKSVFERLTELSPEELKKRTSLGDPNTTALWCPMREVIVEDFRMSCPVAGIEAGKLEHTVWVNQMDMSITQFGFVGLVVTYPDYFGLHDVTEDDLEAFCHMWRGLGYLLGIQDRYNFCNGGLQTVRQRTKDFIEMGVKPSFRDVTEEWEHMCRCMVAGIAFYVPFAEFEPSLLYLCYTIGIDTPKLKQSISFRHYIKFLAYKLLNFLERVPGVLPMINKKMNEFVKRAQEASPEQLAEWEATEFPYMNQPGKVPIRS